LQLPGILPKDPYQRPSQRSCEDLSAKIDWHEQLSINLSKQLVTEENTANIPAAPAKEQAANAAKEDMKIRISEPKNNQQYQSERVH
jgi:hypothetical protein